MTQGERAILSEHQQDVTAMLHVWRVAPDAGIFWHFPETRGAKIVSRRLAKRGLLRREIDPEFGPSYRITEAGLAAMAEQA